MVMIRKLSPEKQERFKNAALNLFVAHGVQNTSTAAIAKEAGTAAGTLFLYFPTKQDLIDELVLDIGRAQSETIKSTLKPALSARETFLTIWNCSIRWFLDNMEAYRYIQQVRDSGLIGETVVRKSSKFFEFYYSAIQKGLSENSIMPYPVELIGEILYRDIVAVMNLLKAQPGREKREEYIRSGFEIFWNGIKTAH
jgi:AcrR family transcriptional regulator